MQNVRVQLPQVAVMRAVCCLCTTPACTQGQLCERPQCKERAEGLQMELSPRALLLTVCSALSRAVPRDTELGCHTDPSGCRAALPLCHPTSTAAAAEDQRSSKTRKGGSTLTENVSLRAVLASKKKGAASPSISKVSGLSCPGCRVCQLPCAPALTAVCNP